MPKNQMPTRKARSRLLYDWLVKRAQAGTTAARAAHISTLPTIKIAEFLYAAIQARSAAQMTKTYFAREETELSNCRAF
jgi:hypothetical protein